MLMAVITITILLWFSEGENKTKTVNVGPKLWISYPILLVEIMIVIIRIDQEKYLFSLLDLCPPWVKENIIVMDVEGAQPRGWEQSSSCLLD